MLTIYGIPTCDTIKKARIWLESQGMPFLFHNYKTDGISPEKAQKWLEEKGAFTIINQNGSTWKLLSEEEKSYLHQPKKLIALMQKKPSIIKRPIVEQDDKILLLGFDEKVWQNYTFKSSNPSE